MIKTEYNSLLFKLAAKLGVLMIAVILTIVIILDLSIGQTVVMIFTILGVFFLFFIVFRRDIKAFKDFANNLSDKSDFYRQIVVNSLNGLIIAKDGRIVFFNDSAKILFIRTSNNLKNLEIEELIHPSDRDKFSEFITKLPNDKVIFRANVNTLSSQYRYVALNVKNYLINNEPVLYINATDCSKIHLEMLNSKKKIALLSEAIDAFSFGFDIYTKEGEAAYRNSFSQSNKDAQAAKNLQAEIENNFNKSALGNGFNIAAKGDQFSKDLIVARHNGEQWNNVTFSPLYVENQQYVLKITDDITNFKNDINELKLYSNAYEQVLKSSNMAFVIIDKNENIIFENDKFYQMLDLDAELVAKDRIRTAAKDFFKILNPKNIVISLHETNEKISFTEANIDNGIEKICSKITNSDSFEVEIKIETKYLKYFLEKESEKKDEIINTAKIIDLKSKAYPVYNYNGEFTFTIIEFVEVTTLHNLTEKYNIARTYLDAIANNFYVGIIFIINQNDEIVFIGGEEAIKKSIHISGLSTRLFFQLSQIPELVELEKT